MEYQLGIMRFQGQLVSQIFSRQAELGERYRGDMDSTIDELRDYARSLLENQKAIVDFRFNTLFEN